MPVSELENFLRIPKHCEEDEWAWERLTTENTLFRTLHKAVRNHSINGESRLLDLANTWQPFVNKDKENRQNQLGTIRTLVWCAEQAANRPDQYQNEIDCGKFMRLAPKPDFIEGNKERAWVWIRTFLDAPSWRVEVPVSGCKEDIGFLATLVLEVLHGTRQIAHHPQDAFYAQYTQANKDFHDSMQQAWTAARDLVKNKHGEFPRLDGRWRLLKDWSPNALERKKRLPVKEANDRSASGAAAWGWYFALQHKIPDEMVIVLAQIDRNGVLSKVDGIVPKVMAIVRDGSFDTIAVTSENLQETKEAVANAVKEGIIKQGAIRVKQIDNDTA